MTTATDRFPEWIRRKLADRSTGESAGGRFEGEPVVVWEALNAMEAEVVRGRLEAAGIPAIIRSESLGQIYGLTMGGLARADVLVPALLADQAIDLLGRDVTDEEVDGEESNGTAG